MPEIISKNDYISHIFEKFPSARRVFIDKSMRCFACDIMKFATVEECCRNHKIRDINSFVKNLNKTKGLSEVNAP